MNFLVCSKDLLANLPKELEIEILNNHLHPTKASLFGNILVINFGGAGSGSVTQGAPLGKIKGIRTTQIYGTPVMNTTKTHLVYLDTDGIIKSNSNLNWADGTLFGNLVITVDNISL